MTPEYFRTLADYNSWANRRLYSAVASLPAAEIACPRAAFFGSILGTLNHLLVADRVWLGRIVGRPVSGLELNSVLYTDFDELAAARTAEDERLSAVVAGLDAAALAAPLHYHSMAGDACVTPMHWVLAHMFNHQTHHRGQVHDMLSQTAVAPPPLDLLMHLRQAGLG